MTFVRSPNERNDEPVPRQPPRLATPRGRGGSPGTVALKGSRAARVSKGGRRVSRGDAAVHAAAVLAGAALVFQIQPIVGKLLLPTFGGGASVWITCMFFFQGMLLAGYGYTHILTSLHPRRQAVVHAVLLVISLLFLPVSTAAEGMDTAVANPGWLILLVLLGAIGMPFVMLASTAPLIQRWSSLTRPSRAPWRLYALSNAGALAALLTYPFLVEPHMALRAQTLTWSAGYLTFLVASLTACRMLWVRQETAGRAAAPSEPAEPGERLTPGAAALGVALAACGVVLLLAVTNQITQNIAPVPFLWILPLVVYLLTWIVCFSGERWYDRPVWGSLLIVSGSTLIILDFFGTAFPVVPAVTAWLLVLFCLCMVCHGELYRLRPEPRQLSLYYLLIAFGGAAGGALVSLVAPAVFVRYWEGLAAAYALYLAFGILVLRRGRGKGGEGLPRVSPRQAAVDRWSRRLFAGGWATGVLVFPAIVAVLDALRPEYDVAGVRNFYGVLNVRDITDDADPARRVLIDGTTIHGFQLLDEDRRMQPTSYYGRRTGIGLVMDNIERSDEGLHVGVVGLGTGTLAAWGRPGDVFRFYELNPAVLDLARAHFSFLRDSPATVEVVLGDGRISLERELERIGSRNYDVLVLDAFSSGAIPVHLLTREAVAVYLAHLASDGILAFHVTNSYLDLSPVIANLASSFDKRALLVTTVVDTGVSSRSGWVLLVEGEWLPGVETPQNVVPSPLPPPDTERVWTDDYSDLLSTLRP